MTASPEFTTDWFGERARWLELFGPLIGRPGLRYLEVGTFEGRSLLWMMQNIFTHPTSRAVAIDPCFTPYGQRLRTNLAGSEAGARVELIQGTSRQEMWRLPRESFDVIMIDGSHLASDVLHDAVMAWELLKVDGVLILDDYQLGTPQDPEFRRDIADELRPREAIDGFLRCNRRDLEILFCDHHLVVRKKPCFATRYEVSNYGNAQFCSAIGAQLYYWDQRKLVILPEVRTVPLDDADARIVEKSLLEDERAADDPKVQAILSRVRAVAGEGREPIGAAGAISTPNAFRRAIQRGGHIIVQNKAWAGPQTLDFRGSDFRITRQEAQSSSTPISFPSVFTGVNHGRSTSGGTLPRLAREIRRIGTTWRNNAGSVPGDYVATCGASFSTLPGGDAGAPSGGNLRLWDGSSGRMPHGTCMERDLAIAGARGRWALWHGPDGEGPAINYVSGSPINEVDVDLNGFITHARRHGFLPDSTYLSSVYAGFLIWSGGVGLESESFSVQIE